MKMAEMPPVGELRHGSCLFVTSSMSQHERRTYKTHKTSVKVETADWSSVHCVILPTSFQFSVSSSRIGKGRNLPEPAHKLFGHLSIITAIPCKESQSRKAFFEASASTQTFLSKVEVPLVCLRRQERKTRRPGFRASFVSPPPTRVEHTKARARNCCPRPS